MREAAVPVLQAFEAPPLPAAEPEPYPGLRPFRGHEACFHFGRDAVVSGMLQMLLSQRVLALIGPSGSGRTSLVSAGLVPALLTGWSRPDDEWRVAHFVPAIDPMRELAEALLAATALGPELAPDASPSARALIEAELRQGPLGLAELVRDAQRARPEERPFQFLLVVDAFDALLPRRDGSADRQDERDAVINLILGARARLDATGIHVVLVITADRMGECALVPDLPEAIAGAQVIVPAFDPDQLVQAISGPAATAGGQVEPEAAQALARQLAGAPDALPLLQSVMAETWHAARRRSRTTPTILHADIAALGDVRSIVQTRAERALAAMDAGSRLFAERLLCALVDTGGEAGLTTWRAHSLALARAAEVCGLPTERWRDLLPIVDALGSSRAGLLHVAQPAAADAIVEFVRPALVAQWPRLREMLVIDQERARQYARLRDRILGQPDKPLGRAELAMALEWRDGVPPTDFAVAEGEAPEPVVPIWQPTAGWALRHANAGDDGATVRDFERVMGIIGKTESRVRRREQAEEERRQNALKTLMKLRTTDKRAADQQIANERAAAEAARQEERRLAAYAMSIQSALEAAEESARRASRRARIAAVAAALLVVSTGLMSWVVVDAEGSARVARALGLPTGWMQRTAADGAPRAASRNPSTRAFAPAAAFADDRPR